MPDHVVDRLYDILRFECKLTGGTEIPCVFCRGILGNGRILQPMLPIDFMTYFALDVINWVSETPELLSEYLD